MESKCLNVKMNVKSNSVFIIRVQGMALVSCTGAEIALERIKGNMMSEIYFKAFFLLLKSAI